MIGFHLAVKESSRGYVKNTNKAQPAKRAIDPMTNRYDCDSDPHASAVARSAGSRIFRCLFLGLTPQALCYRPLRGLRIVNEPRKLIPTTAELPFNLRL
jgi:hypothetical protein